MIKNNIEVNDSFYRDNLRDEDSIRIPSAVLLGETVDFLEEYYNECFEIDINARFSGTVLISPRKLARLLKLLLKSSFGTQNVSMSATTDRTSLTISVTLDPKSCSAVMLSHLSESSINSGFNLENEDGKIFLKTMFVGGKSNKIYAVSKRIVYISLRKEFAV